jgi:hypothetical protein
MLPGDLLTRNLPKKRGLSHSSLNEEEPHQLIVDVMRPDRFCFLLTAALFVSYAICLLFLFYM